MQLLPLLEIHALDGKDECAQLQAVLARLAEYDLVPSSRRTHRLRLCALARLAARCAAGVGGEGSKMALAAHGVTEANAAITSPLDTARSDSEQLLLALDLPACAASAC